MMLRLLALGASVALVAVLPAAAALFKVFDSGEMPIPTANSGATALAAGHTMQCRIWFVERSAGKIGCVFGDMFGIREWPLTRGSEPAGIVAGEDGTPWFTEFGARKIGTVTERGKIRELPLSHDVGAPLAIVAGSNSSHWFSSMPSSRLHSIHKDGALGVTIAVPGQPCSLVTDPRLPYVWYIEKTGARIGRVDRSGHVTTYTVMPLSGATRDVTSSQIAPSITVTADGTIWFTEAHVPSLNGAAIGRLETNGKVTFFRIPTPDGEPAGLEWDGIGLWFTEYRSSKIGLLRADGTIQEFNTPTPHAGPLGISEDDKGMLWFVEHDVNKLGWFQLMQFKPVPAGSKR